MRHATRHIHATLVDLVRTYLDDAGWITPPINYGATKVTIQPVAPSVPSNTEPNTVGVSLEYPDSSREAELGGGLMRRRYSLFVDVFGENDSTTKALVDDVCELLDGLRAPVMDWTGPEPDESSSSSSSSSSSQEYPAPTSHYIEIDEFDVDEPPAAGQVDRTVWRVVVAQVDVYFVGDL